MMVESDPPLSASDVVAQCSAGGRETGSRAAQLCVGGRFHGKLFTIDEINIEVQITLLMNSTGSRVAGASGTCTA